MPWLHEKNQPWRQEIADAPDAAPRRSEDANQLYFQKATSFQNSDLFYPLPI